MRKWNRWIRQTHRWLSIVFTTTVIANIVALAAGDGQPPALVTYAPLIPLAFLLLTGLYLFVLPYAGKRRNTEAPTEISAPTRALKGE